MIHSGYDYFNGDNPSLAFSGSKESHSSFSSKEEFLSFLINRSFHMSANCFKQNGCGSFNTAVRFNADQHFVKVRAFSEGIEKTGVLADKLYASIRCHPLQSQRHNNIVLHSPKDQPFINSFLIEQAFKGHLDPYLLSFLIAKLGFFQASSRIMASYSFGWPLVKSIRLFHGICKDSSNPIKDALFVVLRLLVQKTIWWYKIQAAR